MGHRIAGRLVLGALVAATLAAVPAAASARTVWLCQPGHPGPCSGSLTTTLLAPDGTVGATERTAIARRAPIDCFYVYPTVSEQKAPAADLTVDQAERSIALYQAARFSSVCRVWAPMYRQVTLAGLANPSSVTPAMRERAYADVRSAWRDYLAHANHGRGVVLIGHSQGTFVLRRLITEEIDARPSVRRRLVSALLLGGNVTVAKGRDVGGDFQHVPACRAATQTGCVVAYSTFNAPVPANAVFGRVHGADAARLEILCTNPAALGGGSGPLDTDDPTTPFGGGIGAAIDLLGARPPALPTPWAAYRGAYTAECSTADDADVLQVTPVDGAPVLRAVPDAGWGLHLADVNIALGNLTALVSRQAAAWGRPARHPSALRRPAPQLYVSLGDSYASGYQPTGVGVGANTTNGFAYQLPAAARPRGYRLRLVNFGCGGATTTSILERIGCPPAALGPGGVAYDRTTQAAAAAAYIKAHRRQIALITVSIGGNDVTSCARAADPIPCVGAAVAGIKQNVTALARQLRAAAGPKTRIVGITYPDVVLGAWVQGTESAQSLANLSVVAFKSLINPALAEAYAGARGGFVDVTAATGAYGPMDQTRSLAPYGAIPVPVAQVCELTYYCEFGDIHARTGGYRLIADLIAQTLPRRRR